jgi:hypothetical protein
MYRGLGIEGLKAIGREGLKGLSIVTLAGLTPNRQIVKAICRQIDKPQYAQYHRYKGLSSPLKSREYKRHTNIPIGIQTISSGYKGLDNMPDIKGLIYMV